MAIVHKHENKIIHLGEGVAFASRAAQDHSELRNKMQSVLDDTRRPRQPSRQGDSMTMSEQAVTKSELSSPATLANRSLDTSPARWTTPQKPAGDVDMS